MSRLVTAAVAGGRVSLGLVPDEDDGENSPARQAGTAPAAITIAMPRAIFCARDNVCVVLSARLGAVAASGQPTGVPPPSAAGSSRWHREIAVWTWAEWYWSREMPWEPSGNSGRPWLSTAGSGQSGTPWPRTH